MFIRNIIYIHRRLPFGIRTAKVADLEEKGVQRQYKYRGSPSRSN